MVWCARIQSENLSQSLRMEISHTQFLALSQTLFATIGVQKSKVNSTCSRLWASPVSTNAMPEPTTVCVNYSTQSVKPGRIVC